MLPTVRRCGPTSATSGISLRAREHLGRVDRAAARPAALKLPAPKAAIAVSRAGGLPSCFCFTQPTTSRSPVAGRAMRDHPACVLVDDRHLVEGGLAVDDQLRQRRAVRLRGDRHGRGRLQPAD